MTESGLDVKLTSPETNGMTSFASTLKDFQEEPSSPETNAPVVALPEVFSESGLDVEYHRVATDPLSSKPLTATLHMPDVLKNKNSFYKLQVVVSDPPSLSSATSAYPEPQKFYFVRAWGRLGLVGSSQACK
jgi:hypothetical protein